jgi:predicted permease
MPGADERDAVLGDMTEEYGALLAEHGRRAARAWYWQQTARSVLPNLVRASRRNQVRLADHRTGANMMETLLLDLRYGIRMLNRRRAVTIVSVTSLTLGIALSTVVFSLLNAVLLRPLPVRDPDALGVLLEQRKDGVNHNFSYPDFADFRAAQRSFEDLIAFSKVDVTVRHGNGSQVVAAEVVSGEYFELLGVEARAGRRLSTDDDRSAAQPTAVVSDSLWRQIAGSGNGAFAPRSIRINEREFTVAGVIAGGFRGMEVGRDVRVWVPLHALPLLDPRDAAAFQRRTLSFLTVMGRLREKAAFESAAADLASVDEAIARTGARPQARTFMVVSGRQGDSSLPQTAGGPLKLLLGAALLVLLVACANVSSLLLARATEREREIAVRSALGAGRVRLARLVLVEAVCLAAIGGLGGILAARWLAGLAAPLISTFGEPATLDVSLDWRTLGFVISAVVFSTVLAGLAPLAAVLRASGTASLKEGGRAASTGPSAARAQRALLVGQFALSLTLVVAAVLLARTVHNLRTLPTGLDLDQVMLLSVDPAAAQMNAARAGTYFTEVLTALEAHPGVTRAGFGRVIPLGFGGSRTTIAVPGYEPAADEDMEINFNTISPSYFEALGIRLREGRGFTEHDSATRPPVLIVNETMARRYWPGRSAVGQRVVIDPARPPCEVVGIAPDVKYRTLRESPGPSFYLPLAQDSARRGVLHVRTDGDPRALLQDVRRIVAGVNPGVPITGIRTLRDQATLNMNDERIAMLIGLSLGVAALLLAAVGLYGSISYMVGQRTRELGVRIALGATVRDIHVAVLRQGVTIAAIGAVLGIVLAVAVTRTLEDRLFGVAANDPITIVMATAVLTSIALLASWAPARRAAKVDPLQALRVE